MKSIKEKSNEYARDYLFSPLPQRTPNIHFEAGANYVLDEVECILEDNNLWDCEEICNELKELIEQLKKLLWQQLDHTQPLNKAVSWQKYCQLKVRI